MKRPIAIRTGGVRDRVKLLPSGGIRRLEGKLDRIANLHGGDATPKTQHHRCPLEPRQEVAGDVPPKMKDVGLRVPPGLGHR